MGVASQQLRLRPLTAATGRFRQARRQSREMIGKYPRIVDFHRRMPQTGGSSTSRSFTAKSLGRVARWPTEEWQTSPPEALGMESQALADYVALLAEPAFHVDSLLLVRNGYIVAEACYHPYECGTKRHTYSVSKSLISALIGVAIKQGDIESIDKPVLDFFPDMPIANVDERKKALTLRHLLTMTSGLACDWAFGTSVDNAMRASRDWAQFALSLPMMAEPGVEFHYCNANAHILSAVITQQTGMSALEYARSHLFAPLGITDAAWTSSPTGISHGAGELQLTPRDMAKIGYLYLRRGEWAGQQLIPAEWVTTSTTERVPYLPDYGYGYMWWTLDSLGMSMAIGFGGQYIWLLPRLDLVVVITGGATDDLRFAYRFPAILAGLLDLAIADHPLPENPGAFARLWGVLDSVANPEPLPLPPQPEMVRRISGRIYHLLTPNLLTTPGHSQFRVPEGRGVSAWETQTLSLTFDGSEASLALTFADAEEMRIAVGLDGLSRRTTSGRLGGVGARGHWLTDTTFCLYLQHLGDCTRYRMDMTFTEALLEIVVFEVAAGEAHVVFGLAGDGFISQAQRQ